MIKESKEITQLNDATDWINTYENSAYHVLNASIAVDGSWSGTITLQKTNDGGSTVRDVEDFSTDEEFQVEDPIPGVQYRLKCTSYSAGTATVELYK